MLTTENTKGDLCRGRLNETLNSLATKYQTPAPKSSQDRSDDALPTGSDYERYLLGCALENHELINQITWSISDDFLLPDHRAIWEALLELNEEGLGAC